MDNAADFVGQKHPEINIERSDTVRVSDPTLKKRAKSQKQDLRIKLNDIVNFLKKQGYPLENTFVSYYSSIFSAYINCNLDPISDSVQITVADLETIDNTEALKLKFQKGITK